MPPSMRIEIISARSVGEIVSRGDGCIAGEAMSERQAEEYHGRQVKAFAATACDMVSAVTMTNIPEEIGVARAAKAAQMPVVISFTVETDGKLPSGDTVESTILATDMATGNYPAYYMINCAHPRHFDQHLGNGSWLDRIGGIRANASSKRHAELDASTELDAGDPQELGRQYRDLRKMLSKVNVVGGCCGTDHRHIAEIFHSCAA